MGRAPDEYEVAQVGYRRGVTTWHWTRFGGYILFDMVVR